jgi:hypothetical protein
MNLHREIAHRIDPALWVREILGMTPAPWQETFLRAPRGASILALTARQVGKTVIAFPEGCATLLERGPGVSVEQVVAATEAKLALPDKIPEMQ